MSRHDIDLILNQMRSHAVEAVEIAYGKKREKISIPRDY
jgi:hypothetical protein